MVAPHEKPPAAPRQAVDPGDRMLPRILRGIGQREELVERPVGDGFGPQPRPGHPAQLQFGPHDQARKPDATHGGREPIRSQRRAALDRFAVRARKPKPAHVVAEGAEPMVILSMHVVGNGAPDRDHLRAGCHGQQPSVGDRQPLDIAQQHPGFAGQNPAIAVIRDQMIQSPRQPQGAAGIQAGISIAAPHAERHARACIPQGARNRARIMERKRVLRIARQAPPGTDRPHAASWRKTKRLSSRYFATYPIARPMAPPR